MGNPVCGIAPSRTGLTGPCAAVVAFAAWLATAFGAPLSACSSSSPSPIELDPGQIAFVDVAPESPVLLEEMGVDVEYRWAPNAAFTAIDTPPGRLGFAVLPASAAPLNLRIRPGQGRGRVWVSDCIAAGDALFHAQLAQLQTTYLRSGPEAAGLALNLLDALLRLPLDARQRARVASAHANALLSAGRLDDAEVSFAASRERWFVAGRSDSAAVALMAQGENASRTGRFADADRLLGLASDELARAGVTYFALRSQAAACTVLSRRGRFEESVACETHVLDAMLRTGEEIEAATRQVSLSNQYMRLNDFARSRELLLAADPIAPRMSPVVRARLESTWGSYLLYTGDLPAAAARFAQATAALGDQGLPGDQAMVDLKLASLAALSGARSERRRLLERAAGRLNAQNAAPHLADVRLQLARSARETAEPLAAAMWAQGSRELCQRIDDRECGAAARTVEAQALIDLGKLDMADSLLAAAPVSDAALTRLELALARARLELAYGRPELALQQLPAALATTDDLNLQAQYAQLRAASLAALGDRAGAVAGISEIWTRQLRQAERWPSAALRISARNRLAELQSTLIGLLLARASAAIDEEDFARVVDAVNEGSVHRLFQRASSTAITDSLRRALSEAVSGAGTLHERDLFVALAQTRDGAADEVDAKANEAPPPGAALDRNDVVVLPLQGEQEFLLLASRAGSTRLCRRWPAQRYVILVARYERALDGETEDLAALDREALDWRSVLDRCHPDRAPATRWHIVSVPGTRPLPWAWIAATATDAATEPLVSTTFRVPQRGLSALPRPALVTLLDLDMPNVSALPFATRERDTLERLLGARGIPQRSVIGADDTPAGVLAALSTAPVVHVIGHANPASYGQLYQGLWFESQRRPSLLTYPEITATRSQAELVVLSACGTTVAAQATFGATSRLAEAFVAAGALRVVAASNALSDSASPIWTRAFHDSLWESGDVAAAARDARRALRASPHFRHPKFWAGIEVYASAGPVTPPDD